MTAKRVFYLMILAAFVMAGCVFASLWQAQRMLSRRSDSLVAVKLENRSLDEQQNALVQANKDIQKYAELNQIAKTIVPQDKDQAATVREIVKIAESAGVKLSGISFPASTLGQSGGTAGKTQLKPAPGLSGVYSMEITIQQDTNSPVTYPVFIDFLSKLENNRRTAQVSAVSAQPTAKDRNKLTFTLTVSVYIKP